MVSLIHPYTSHPPPPPLHSPDLRRYDGPEVVRGQPTPPSSAPGTSSSPTSPELAGRKGQGRSCGGGEVVRRPRKAPLDVVRGDVELMARMARWAVEIWVLLDPDACRSLWRSMTGWPHGAWQGWPELGLLHHNGTSGDRCGASCRMERHRMRMTAGFSGDGDKWKSGGGRSGGGVPDVKRLGLVSGGRGEGAGHGRIEELGAGFGQRVWHGRRVW